MDELPVYVKDNVMPNKEINNDVLFLSNVDYYENGGFINFVYLLCFLILLFSVFVLYLLIVR